MTRLKRSCSLVLLCSAFALQASAQDSAHVSMEHIRKKVVEDSVLARIKRAPWIMRIRPHYKAGLTARYLAKYDAAHGFGVYPEYAYPIHKRIINPELGEKKGLFIGTDLGTLVIPEPDAISAASGPSLVVGYRISRRFSTSLTATALLYDLFHLQNPDIRGVAGFRLAQDLKYFMGGGGLRSRFFIGVQGFYTQFDYREYAEKGSYENNLWQTAGSGFYKRTQYAWGLTPIVGVQRYLDKTYRLQFELQVGLGLQSRRVNYHGVAGPVTRDHYNYDSNYPYVEFYDNHYPTQEGLNPYFTFGLRFTYRL